MCCSFCLKDKNAGAKLVAGPGVYICNECVDLCNQIIPVPVPEFGGWTEQPDDALLASLARIQAAVSQVDDAVHDHVDSLRARGNSWTRIGEALGVSKQAAWDAQGADRQHDAARCLERHHAHRKGLPGDHVHVAQSADIASVRDSGPGVPGLPGGPGQAGEISRWRFSLRWK